MRLSKPQSRLRSLDIFRGITIASMILVNSPGAPEDTYAPLLHAQWIGWTFADTIFPFFLWIVGVALTLSLAAHLERNEGQATVFQHALQRSVLLFVCGVALEALVFPIRSFPYFAFGSYVQFTGVLQKIAICYLAAVAIFLWSSWRAVIVWIIALNLVYLGLLLLYPVPGCNAAVWTIDCNFAGYIDRLLLRDHLRQVVGSQDPDGIGSMLPAVTSVLLGVLGGYVLRLTPDPERRIVRLGAMGCCLVVVGQLLAFWIPISKPLWTPSYALFMAGLASMCMAFWYWAVDVKQCGRWFTPLEIFGMNAIAAYIVSSAGRNVAKVHFSGTSLYDVCLTIASPANASLIYAVTHVVAVYVVVWLLYQRGWFLRF
jgi:predicted acyltransferase